MSLPPSLPIFSLPPRAILLPGRAHGNALSRQVPSKHRTLFGSIDLWISEHMVIASSFLGQGSAELLIDTLIANGVREILFVGFVGALTRTVTLKHGQLVCPKSYRILNAGGIIDLRCFSPECSPGFVG